MLSALTAEELGKVMRQLCELIIEGKEPKEPEQSFRIMRPMFEQKPTLEDLENIAHAPAPKKFDFKGYLIAKGVPEQVAHDWLEVRKKKRAANTETAMKGFEREVNKAGISFTEAVTMCVERNWQGFKASWYNNEMNNRNGISEQGRQDRRREGGVSDWTGQDNSGTF